jgi:hypothetical protein
MPDKQLAMDDVLPLDGNAVGGALAELFAIDVTSAVITCVECATSAEIGAIRVYGGTMGAILRCAQCDNVVLRFVRTPTRSTLDMRGTRTLVVRRVA